jgi:hypothetical protein
MTGLWLCLPGPLLCVSAVRMQKKKWQRLPRPGIARAGALTGLGQKVGKFSLQ